MANLYSADGVHIARPWKGPADWTRAEPMIEQMIYHIKRNKSKLTIIHENNRKAKLKKPSGKKPGRPKGSLNKKETALRLIPKTAWKEGQYFSVLGEGTKPE